MTACVLWLVDWFAFESRYSHAVWREAKHQSELFNDGVKRWLDKVQL